MIVFCPSRTTCLSFTFRGMHMITIIISAVSCENYLPLVHLQRYKYINIIWFCSNWLAMSNSCYNPFIYGLLNEKFKREFRLLFHVCACRRSEKESELGEYSDDSAINRGSTVMLNGRDTLQLNGKLHKSRRKTRPTHTNETEQSLM